MERGDKAKSVVSVKMAFAVGMEFKVKVEFAAGALAGGRFDEEAAASNPALESASPKERAGSSGGLAALSKASWTASLTGPPQCQRPLLMQKSSR